MKKSIITISIVSALAGAGLLGAYLTSELSEENYKILTEGIASKYDLSQIAGDSKITLQEAYILIDAWDRKLKEKKGLNFTDIDTKDYLKSLPHKMNNYLRYASENILIK